MCKQDQEKTFVCVCVEEALRDRGTLLDTRNSVEAKHYQPTIMPRASLSCTAFQAVGGFKVSRCVCADRKGGSDPKGHLPPPASDPDTEQADVTAMEPMQA